MSFSSFVAYLFQRFADVEERIDAENRCHQRLHSILHLPQEKKRGEQLDGADLADDRKNRHLRLVPKLLPLRVCGRKEIKVHVEQTGDVVHNQRHIRPLRLLAQRILYQSVVTDPLCTTPCSRRRNPETACVESCSALVSTLINGS